MSNENGPIICKIYRHEKNNLIVSLQGYFILLISYALALCVF